VSAFFALPRMARRYVGAGVHEGGIVMLAILWLMLAALIMAKAALYLRGRIPKQYRNIDQQIDRLNHVVKTAREMDAYLEIRAIAERTSSSLACAKANVVRNRTAATLWQHSTFHDTPSSARRAFGLHTGRIAGWRYGVARDRVQMSSRRCEAWCATACSPLMQAGEDLIR
jgi:hypothetical protein